MTSPQNGKPTSSTPGQPAKPARPGKGGGKNRHVLVELQKDWAKMSEAEKDAFVEKLTAATYDD